MPGASAMRLRSTRSQADHPSVENFRVERMTLRTTKAGPDSVSSPAHGRGSDDGAGNLDGARAAAFRATESEQLQQDGEQFHENSLTRGVFADTRTHRGSGVTGWAPAVLQKRRSGSARGSVGTSACEELEEDGQEVTEFSRHTKCSLFEGNCAQIESDGRHSITSARRFLPGRTTFCTRNRD